MTDFRLRDPHTAGMVIHIPDASDRDGDGRDPTAGVRVDRDPKPRADCLPQLNPVTQDDANPLPIANRQSLAVC